MDMYVCLQCRNYPVSRSTTVVCDDIKDLEGIKFRLSVEPGYTQCWVSDHVTSWCCLSA